MLLGKNVAPLPPFENFQIRQTMCVLIATFSNMATNDQAIMNPPASFRSAVWKYYGFPTKDGTTDKSRTICKICFATFKYCAASTSSMSAHLKSQHSIDEKSEVKCCSQRRQKLRRVPKTVLKLDSQKFKIL